MQVCRKRAIGVMERIAYCKLISASTSPHISPVLPIFQATHEPSGIWH